METSPESSPPALDLADSLHTALATDWEDLVAPLAPDLLPLAQQTGAWRRQRALRTAAGLLRLLLMYACLGSLRATVIWAASLGLCDISRQALEKRLMHSEAWLRAVLARVLQLWCPVLPALPAPVRRVLLRDASTLARPGSSGTEWRVHLSLELTHLQAQAVTLSDAHGAEGLADAGLQAGDLLLGDRAYGLWKHIQTVLTAAAWFIFRLAWSNCPLCTRDGQPLDWATWLSGLPASQEQTELAIYVAADPQRRPLRLLAGRLPPEAAQAAQARILTTAHQTHRQILPTTLIAAQFCVLLTNLPGPAWPLAVILALYRLRWQVEWCFRRWKSLCALDQLPALPATLAPVVVLGKLLLIMLLQHQLADFPLYWEGDAEPEVVAVVSTVVTLGLAYLRDLICPARALRTFLTQPERFRRHLHTGKRQRPVQWAQARQLLLKIFCQAQAKMQTELS